jgi:hypothetical protein
MTSVAIPRDARSGRRAGRSRRSKIVAILVAVLFSAGLLALRLATEGGATKIDSAATARFVPLPQSPAIAAAWGIRFTGLFMEADRGLIDLRYQVVDPAKSGRIHGGAATNPDPNAAVKALPTFIDENNGKKIYPTSAMLAFEHFHFQTELLGNTYSIIYGNSGGAVHVGDTVTIVMADGLQLHHVVAAN